ncbi:MULTISPECIES: endoribonuclease MazF [Cysteiniphilum]|uniref:endoribonuclease MazF n=1 Tax=Cysteiniphilum TaxID=2056696 RepID=UPI001784A7E4|nr:MULTISPECIES: endoribonuclease MazF [Cysteiniphilum]
MVRYVPDAGDIVWLDFDPQAGREQKGHRPALVISPKVYNAKTRLMLCCPMTTKIKGYPFEVAVASEKESVILSDQIKSLDWQQRNAKFKGRISVVELEDVCDKIKAILPF